MFEIFHRHRGPPDVIKGAREGNWRLTWERRELPGAGAQQYAFVTYAMPPYPVFGNSYSRVLRPLRETTPANYQLLTTPLVGNPPAGYFQGQFTTQPLMDPNSAVAAGVMEPDSVPPSAYNLIPPAGPVLAP